MQDSKAKDQIKCEHCGLPLLPADSKIKFADKAKTYDLPVACAYPGRQPLTVRLTLCVWCLLSIDTHVGKYESPTRAERILNRIKHLNPDWKPDTSVKIIVEEGDIEL
ncbi:MAG: hypothetical protein ABSD58_08065 [Verrucomicrobiia bacterium]